MGRGRGPVVTERLGGPGRANVLRGDVRLPALVVKEEALANNVAVMAAYARDHGFVLAPHAKTTMAPALWQRQLDAGAWGLTVADTAQADLAVRAGAPRVLVANEVVSRADAAWLAARLAGREAEIYCLFDSVAGVDRLDGLLAGHLGADGPGRVVGLVELGAPGGRAGARDHGAALAVARALAAARHLGLAGVEGYEGAVASGRGPEDLARAGRYLEGLRRLAADVARTGLFAGPGPMVVSAGGSKYFDLVAAVLGPAYGVVEVTLVVRSGCYLLHDHGIYERSSPLSGTGPGHLVAAMEIWAEVLSRPEPELAIVGLGRRDTSYDAGLPVPLALAGDDGAPVPLAGAHLSGLDDQHGYLQLGPFPQAGSVTIGTRVAFGPSHPCTAFDKWRQVLLVDQAYDVLGTIGTCFH
jgi:D-serine deaminase-like pyridoxal phosphate-dependent protein